MKHGYKNLKQAYRAGRQAFLKDKQPSVFVNIASEQRKGFYDGYYDAKIELDMGPVLERMTGKGWEREEPVEL